ncbi:hypothetical protein CACET_c13110 [Clostridium aceticum]|uniref:Uncharacterized protein n=1 Tax=Clostridium aceticum TaxID=84022 RepID=A0A0D8ICL1_9CLOT|nr:hypothetical protein [Clostridium aceticum]AKL94776.1 hypothetical protein CACET_c13110 [Clostridium aceticum]KJF27722.1 hypothetical protein TZ02_03680 [Clostridium aceticum]
MLNKGSKNDVKEKMMYFILQDKETGDIWTDSKCFNDMESRYNPTGWNYDDVKGEKGRLMFETISKSEFEKKVKELTKIPLGFKIDQEIKDSLEEIAKNKNKSLIDVTTEALQEYIKNYK